MPSHAATPEPSSDPHLVELRAAQEQFISIWGQMGSKWGIPRTMAQVHALLFIEGHPLNSDEIMDRLQISRGNTSMTLRSLLDWSIIQRTHLPGDRKEYFTAEQDVWKLFRTIVRERKKREIDPLLDALNECRSRTTDLSTTHATSAKAIARHNQRLDDMLEVMQLVDQISQRFVSPMGKGLELAARILSRAG